MTANVKIVAVLTARADATERLRDLLDDMLEPSRSEPGNLRYDLWQDQSDSSRFILDELYADADALAAHRATPHFQNYLERSGIWPSAQRSSSTLSPRPDREFTGKLDHGWVAPSKLNGWRGLSRRHLRDERRADVGRQGKGASVQL